MKNMVQSDIKQLLDKIVGSTVNLSDNKKYWMVRTDNGLNYQSFYNKGYVALSLENYPLDLLLEAKKFRDKPALVRQCLKDYIKRYHSEGRIKLNKEPEDKSYSSVIGRIAGHIYSFAFEMNKGDIVIIPSEGSSIISIGRVVDEELQVGDNCIVSDFTFKRSVEWIATIPKRKLDPCLYRALGAHQAVSNISEYAEFIERNYNSIFSIGNECHYVLTINSPKVKARQLTKMMDDMFNLVEDISTSYSLDLDVNSVDMSIYLNSPGKIDLKSSIASSIMLMAIASALSGGTIKYDNLELTNNGLFSSLVQAINEYRNFDKEKEDKYQYSDSYFNSLEVKSVEEWNTIMDRESEKIDNDSLN